MIQDITAPRLRDSLPLRSILVAARMNIQSCNKYRIVSQRYHEQEHLDLGDTFDLDHGAFAGSDGLQARARWHRLGQELIMGRLMSDW
jgi:hypothetical protein